MENISKIWPKWKAVEEIGYGAFGKVYKAERVLSDKSIYSAIKVIELPNSQSEIEQLKLNGFSEEDIKKYYADLKAVYENEILIMENLKSGSNIVKIEDYEVMDHEIGFSIYIRMELLTSLSEYKKTHSFTNAEVAKMAIDICLALENCHEKNIIHRDIKPSNIFVSELGEYKLGDFGVSKEIINSNMTMSQNGSPSYMAPEMIRMEKYGKTVDIYSLGIVLYELLNNNRKPFYPTSGVYTIKDEEMAHRKKLEGEDVPSALNADEAMNVILKKACKANVDERYESASAMKEALTTYIERAFYENNNDFTLNVRVSSQELFPNVKKEKKKVEADIEQKVEEPKVIAEEPIQKKKSSKVMLPLLLVLLVVVGGVLAFGKPSSTPTQDEINEVSQEEKVYLEGIKLFEKAETKEDYENVVEWLNDISEYKDVQSYIDQCEQKIQSFLESNQTTAQITNNNSTSNNDDLSLAPPVKDDDLSLAPPVKDDDLSLAPPIEDDNGPTHSKPSTDDDLTLAPPPDDSEVADDSTQDALDQLFPDREN